MLNGVRYENMNTTTVRCKVIEQCVRSGSVTVIDSSHGFYLRKPNLVAYCVYLFIYQLRVILYAGHAHHTIRYAYNSNK